MSGMTAMTHEDNGEVCWCGPSCPETYPIPEHANGRSEQ